MADERYSSTALQSIYDSEPPIPYHLFQYNNLFLMHESATASIVTSWTGITYSAESVVTSREQDIVSLMDERKNIHDVGLMEIRFDEDSITMQCDVGYDEPLGGPPLQNW